MTAQLIDGAALAKRIRLEAAVRAREMGIRPGLAVILVGDDPASAVYVRNKVKACEEAGFHSLLERHDATLTHSELLARIAALNADARVHGILVQMPLPRHLDAHAVIEAIAPAKDVDGFAVASAGELMAGLPGLRPATPLGCMKLIEATGVPLRGKHAVVIGRSNTVGKPMALLLLQANATVTVCHSATPDLAAFTRQADIVVAAVGRRGTVTAAMVKLGAIVIDVGINRGDDGKLCGDVDFQAVREVAGWITPVPGGVGPMTIAMLLMNTLQAAEQSHPRSAFGAAPRGGNTSGPAKPDPRRSLGNTSPLPDPLHSPGNTSTQRDVMTNPLLSFDTLPDFTVIRPEHVSPAIDALLAQAEAALERAVGPDVAADYDALSAVLDVATERLGRAWGTVSHLNNVADTPELRAAFNDNLPKVTAFHTRLGADERLYAKYKAVAASAASQRLSAPRKKALANALRDFVLSGAELQGAAKQRFTAIQERSAELSQKFSEHVLDATDGFAHYVDTAQLDGVPADVLEATRQAALADGKDGHKLTLHQPVYQPLLQYATDRALRAALYEAYVTRASELGSAAHDNTPLMRELLALRQEAAALLGHATYADVSLVPKMAHTPARVNSFLQDLAQRARPFAERDMSEMRAFAATQLGLGDVQAWDIPFVSEKLKEARYAFSDLEVKRYFTEPKVLAGLFDIVQTVFEVSITPDTAPVWHDNVRFYRVERDGRLLSQFYLDAYARPGKQPGAWMGDARERWARPDGSGTQTPVATLQCNYAPPVGAQPALLTHDDVITLFHEFGHGLHLMLTRIEDLGVSGLQGVEWDAIELPSQFMENFCWEWDVLRRMTAHVDTGDALPRALFDKMVAAKNFQSGLQTLRQVEFGLFDMRIHSEPSAKDRVQQVLDEIREQFAVVKPPPFNRFAHAFSHIFGGGYAAGYYSYKWAEVLSADAWSAFEEAGALSVATGRRLREEILEAGGSRPAMDNFIAFRGREPRIDALLRHQGMA